MTVQIPCQKHFPINIYAVGEALCAQKYPKADMYQKVPCGR